MNISQKIKAARHKAGLTQSELGKKLGVSQNSISQLENPKYAGHSIKTLRKIADALGLKLVVSLETENGK